MKKIFSHRFSIILSFSILFIQTSFAQKSNGVMSYTVSAEQAPSHTFRVQFKCEGVIGDSFDVKMPVWMPGYYQVMDYAKNLDSFSVADSRRNDVPWKMISKNAWRVYPKKSGSFTISYNVKATTQFVATSYLAEDRGYIAPCGVFLHINGMLSHPVTVAVKPFAGWTRVATGLDSIPGSTFSYSAPDFDILYDSPILMGNLEELPPFFVKGIPHRFIGYKLGEFDRAQLMSDLKKVVEKGVEIIGDIPYKHYTFLSIGPGRGGIEHLNSCTISFDGSQLKTHEAWVRNLNFIAHEYFHHFNVKRIRPIELGPFDYDKENRTNGLWVSEGLNVYYEYMIVRRAGLMTEEDLYNAFRENIMNYENKPGHLYQSLAQSSYETWSDGPFGRTGDEINKTISYYDKGPAVGMLLDFAIRRDSRNKHSLDDVMRYMYQEYYQKKKRGFTEQEFRGACETMAGQPLNEVFDYVNTVKDVDYKKYLSFAGLDIDTTLKEVPGPWLGVNVRNRNDSLIITSVDYNSPAWIAGIRPRQFVIKTNGESANQEKWKSLLQNSKQGDIIHLETWDGKASKENQVILGKKFEKEFQISRVQNPDALQKEILESWLKVEG